LPRAHGEELVSKFANASENCRIEGKNNAPGGEEGIDQDLQQKLGADGYVGEIADRRHGICSGMTVAWIASVLNNDEEALGVEPFENYFMSYLRFQGAFLQVKGGGSEKKFAKLAEVMAHNCKKFQLQYVSVKSLKKSIESVAGKKRTFWAIYAGHRNKDGGHAIGLAKAGTRWFAMDPNQALFVYQNDRTFYGDATEYFDRQWNIRPGGQL
jgi:hypothetical protein